MIVAMPSITKKAIRTSVSDNAPLIGQSSNTTPAAMAITAESSAHQKPGALRIQNVVTRPTPPQIRNSQPMTSVKASVAIGAATIAAMPRMTRRMPSIRNSVQ